MDDKEEAQTGSDRVGAKAEVNVRARVGARWMLADLGVDFGEDGWGLQASWLTLMN